MVYLVLTVLQTKIGLKMYCSQRSDELIKGNFSDCIRNLLLVNII